MQYPKQIYVRVEHETNGDPYLLATEEMPDDEGQVAVYRLAGQGEVVVSREFMPGTAIVGGSPDEA